jgi:hypothetical protein
MCGMRPNRMGRMGLPGRRTGDVPPDETGGVNPGAFYGLTPSTEDDCGLS